MPDDQNVRWLEEHLEAAIGKRLEEIKDSDFFRALAIGPHGVDVEAAAQEAAASLLKLTAQPPKRTFQVCTLTEDGEKGKELVSCDGGMIALGGLLFGNYSGKRDATGAELITPVRAFASGFWTDFALLEG